MRRSAGGCPSEEEKEPLSQGARAPLGAGEGVWEAPESERRQDKRTLHGACADWDWQVLAAPSG